MDHRFIIKCLSCGATWDNDYDPPGCENPDHSHEMDVVEIKSDSRNEPKDESWTGDLSA